MTTYLPRLTERERQAIELRYGEPGSRVRILESVGAAMGISTGRARSLVTGAMYKLAALSEAEDEGIALSSEQTQLLVGYRLALARWFETHAKPSQIRFRIASDQPSRSGSESVGRQEESATASMKDWQRSALAKMDQERIRIQMNGHTPLLANRAVKWAYEYTRSVFDPEQDPNAFLLALDRQLPKCEYWIIGMKRGLGQ